MMKKGRKSVMDSIPSSSSPYFGGGEAKARFKHQILLQDYQELVKETEAKKMKLQYAFQRKQKLRAEVKYLRKKYKSFRRNQSRQTRLLPKKMALPVHELQLAQQLNALKGCILPTVDRNQRASKAEIPSTSALFDLNEISIQNAEGGARACTYF